MYIIKYHRLNFLQTSPKGVSEGYYKVHRYNLIRFRSSIVNDLPRFFSNFMVSEVFDMRKGFFFKLIRLSFVYKINKIYSLP